MWFLFTCTCILSFNIDDSAFFVFAALVLYSFNLNQNVLSKEKVAYLDFLHLDCFRQIKNSFLRMKILFLVPDKTFLLKAPVIQAFESFFVFGGQYELAGTWYTLGIIGKLDARSVWSNVGIMKKPRHSGLLAFVDNNFLYFGGRENVRSEPICTEKCSYRDNLMTCSIQAPEIYIPSYFSHVFLVSSYCK